MNIAFHFALLAISSSFGASTQSFSMLRKSDRAEIEAKLDKWKALYGTSAAAHGLTPPFQESFSLKSHTEVELERFHATILEVEEAKKLNPLATFSEFNQFALMTVEEFGQRLKASFGDHNTTVIESMKKINQDPPAAQVDWSTSKCIGRVRNQGNCGSCWAFSSVGTVEAAHCISTGKFIDLSIQQVLSCETTSKGCKGGYPPIAINWMQDGVCLDKAWPYKSGTYGTAGKCDKTCDKTKLDIGKLVRVKGEEALVSSLNVQPVTVLVEAANLVWKNYKTGVITQCPGAGSDHAVVAVGYGTSTSEYFKIKNSWGPEWGDNGYGYLKRGVGGKGMCNIVEQISFPDLNGRNSSPPSPVPSTSDPQTQSPITLTPTNTPTTMTPETPVVTKTLMPTLSPSLTPTSVPTQSPTTTSPKPTITPKPQSSPNTSKPKICGTCGGCFFADVKWCVNADFAKSECEATTGATWCGK